MWEPQRLTTLWVSTACYRVSFTYIIIVVVVIIIIIIIIIIIVITTTTQFVV
jgi:hypothetical protein